MIQFSVSFLGTTVIDKRFSPPMIPWIIADIRRRRKSQKIRLTIENAEIIGEVDDVVLFRHHVQNLHGFGFEPNNVRTFMYLVKVNYEPVLNVYLFQGSAHEDGLEIFQNIRESTREQTNATKCQSTAATLTSLCPDISPTNSQFFEVLYVGKMKISHHKVPETFIDDALEKFRLYEMERAKRQLVRECVAAGTLEKETSKTQSQNEVNANGILEHENGSQIENQKVLEEVQKPGISERRISCESQDQGNINEGFIKIGKNKLDGSSVMEVKNEARPILARAGSMGIIETYRRKGDDQVNQNRTMLFYVGQKDLRLISPDRKIVLFHRMLKDINCCVQGIQNSQHFGLISREISCYYAYVFKCESNSVADHIVSSISQTSQSIKESKERPKQSVASCEHCPMIWFHKLCYDIRDQSEKTRQLTILKRIEGLPEHEQTDIHTKFLGAESSDVKEQNEFLMILLRTHCERKQSEHVHDTEETRSEFLNQVLGGSTIFMKAKRSLTNSFDHLLKRKGSQDVLPSKELINDSSNQDKCHRSYLTVGPGDGEIMMKEISKSIKNRGSNEDRERQKKDRRNPETGVLRKTTSLDTAEGFWSVRTNWQDALDETDTSTSPLMNIFLKVGSASKMPPQNFRIQEEGNQTPNGSWRQAIYNRVVTPGKGIDEGGDRKPRKRNKDELRDLWKTAINQQILLIRMEKENAQLKERQEEATVKRIKLEYDELGSFMKEQMSFWDAITSKDNISSIKCDVHSLLDAVGQGIPRTKRGDVWFHFANQYCLKQPPFDSSAFPNYDVPYEDLLKQLTSFQHTILIDLGRTFPNHPYFSSPLGPGQLALFNLLKAYSLLDPQVGYCQGLSFVAGVLLLHLSEDQAFLLLRHLMFRRNLRKQYLSDLAALQVQLYKLSRLLHDSLPQLYVHFDKNEIAPTLYAASWMLTLFASQFPLGFVTRVFDLLFVEETTDIIFRVIMALLEEHSHSILSLSSFEEIMDYLKNDIPKMDAAFVDRLMKKVLSMDISKQLHEFEVEYHVLQEEISTPRAELDRLKRVDVENKKLMNENMALQEQLEVLTKSLKRLEEFRLVQQGTIKKLENKVKTLEMTVKVLGDFVVETREKNGEIEIPPGIRGLLASMESFEDKDVDKARPPHEKSTFFRKTKPAGDLYDKTCISEFCTVGDLPNGTKFGDRIEGTDVKSGVTETASVNQRALKGISLKVLEDNEKFEPQNPSKISSKITSGVTSFFGNSSISNLAVKRENYRKRSDSVPANVNNHSNDILSLHSKESASRLEKKENLAEGIRPMAVEKVPCTPTNENIKESNQNGHHLHPLGSSNGVNITFNGTTKLKSLKSGPQLMKNHSIDLIPIKKYNKMLHISEDGDP